MSIRINDKTFFWNASEQEFYLVEAHRFPNALPKEFYPFDESYWKRRTKREYEQTRT